MARTAGAWNWLTWAARFCAARLDCDSSRFAFRPSADEPWSGDATGGAGAMDAFWGGAGEVPGLCPDGGAMGIMFGAGAPWPGAARRSG